MKERLKGDKHDFEIEYRGEQATVDVKSTTYSPAWLLVRESKSESDYYIASHLSGPEATEVTFVGWASRSTLLNGDRIKSPAGGSHLNYRLWQDEMESPPPPRLIEPVN